jgi:hypothetical protein
MDLNARAIRFAAHATLAYTSRIAILQPKKLVNNPRAPGMAPFDPIEIACDAVYELEQIGTMLDDGKLAQAFYKLVAAQTALWCTRVVSSDVIDEINTQAIAESKAAS